jgi:hypothetical protein
MIIVTKDAIANGSYDYDHGYDMWASPFWGVITSNYFKEWLKN